jgi:hypothetical protein
MISQVSLACLPNYGEALAAHLVVSLASLLYIGIFFFFLYLLFNNPQVVIFALQQPNISQD